MTLPNYPSQGDYGSGNDNAMVPGSLTVFRHFGINLRTGNIVPMNHRPQRLVSDGFVDRLTGYPYRTPQFIYPADPGRTYEALCTRSPYTAPYGAAAPPGHKSPHLRCTCGFYAHYSQTEDFYETMFWGREYCADIHKGGFEDMAYVLAVVEASGTCIMGRRGVRAEKIKIKAIAIDWSKYRNPMRRAGRPRIGYARDKYAPDQVVSEYDYRYIPSNEPDPDEFAEVTDQVARVCSRYGVDFYLNKQDMYDRHPEEDVSALGVDTSPRPEPEITFFQWASGQGVSRATALQQQAAIYDAAAKAAEVAKTLADTFKGLTASLGIIDEMVVLDEVETAKEKALRLKRNRPAPPGTGIDRRRGRLR